MLLEPLNAKKLGADRFFGGSGENGKTTPEGANDEITQNRVRLFNDDLGGGAPPIMSNSSCTEYEPNRLCRRRRKPCARILAFKRLEVIPSGATQITGSNRCVLSRFRAYPRWSLPITVTETGYGCSSCSESADVEHGGRGHVPGVSTASAGAFPHFSDGDRHASDNVRGADADALPSWSPALGRKIVPRSYQFPSHLLRQGSSRIRSLSRRGRQQYAVLLHPGVHGRLC